MTSCENEFKTRKWYVSYAWDLVRMILKCKKLRFLTLEIGWEWAKHARNSVFSHASSCEIELKTRKLYVSHSWDLVRMSLKCKKLHFLTLEIVWEWAENAINSVFTHVSSCENELRTLKIHFSHAWDGVRMSAESKYTGFLTVLPPQSTLSTLVCGGFCASPDFDW